MLEVKCAVGVYCTRTMSHKMAAGLSKSWLEEGPSWNEGNKNSEFSPPRIFQCEGIQKFAVVRLTETSQFKQKTCFVCFFFFLISGSAGRGRMRGPTHSLRLFFFFCNSQWLSAQRGGKVWGIQTDRPSLCIGFWPTKSAGWMRRQFT